MISILWALHVERHVPRLEGIPKYVAWLFLTLWLLFSIVGFLCMNEQWLFKTIPAPLLRCRTMGDELMISGLLMLPLTEAFTILSKKESATNNEVGSEI